MCATRTGASTASFPNSLSISDDTSRTSVPYILEPCKSRRSGFPPDSRFDLRVRRRNCCPKSDSIRTVRCLPARFQTERVADEAGVATAAEVIFASMIRRRQFGWVVHLAGFNAIQQLGHGFDAVHIEVRVVFCSGLGGGVTLDAENVTADILTVEVRTAGVAGEVPHRGRLGAVESTPLFVAFPVRGVKRNLQAAAFTRHGVQPSAAHFLNEFTCTRQVVPNAARTTGAILRAVASCSARSPQADLRGGRAEFPCPGRHNRTGPHNAEHRRDAQFGATVLAVAAGTS
jgi:hypothetical protein